MKPTPFDPTHDIPPLPFDERHRLAAARLKAAGLPWTPHVGCFVWDRHAHIDVGSPFPGRVYFILNLGHFLKRFGSLDEIAEKLVWLPTWHQTRVLCRRLEAPFDAEFLATAADPGEELLALYQCLGTRLASPAGACHAQ